MAKIGIGESLVMMQGFARQKALAHGPKAARRVAFRRYAYPSETKQSLPARIALAEAAHGAYGKSFEEVVSAVVVACSGKDYGGAAKKEAIRSANHARASASISAMRAKLARV